jgi:hypothetical protein
MRYPVTPAREIDGSQANMSVGDLQQCLRIARNDEIRADPVLPGRRPLNAAST